MNGKDIIKFVQDGKYEDKDVYALLNINHRVFALPVKEISFSNNEDDCIFIELAMIKELPEYYDYLA